MTLVKSVKVKSTESSEIEIFGTIKGKVQVRDISVPLNFSR
jgi:hypothetical protein